MTNGVAIGLVLVIGGFFALDHFVLHLEAGTFLLRKTIAFIQVLAFWR